MERTIIVSQLEVLARIGVPDPERETPQRLTVSMRLIPVHRQTRLDDDIANTVDYATVCEAVCIEAQARPRRLIETLAEDLAALLLTRFPLRAVEIEVRKYILPNAEYAAVRLRLEKDEV